MKSVTGVDINTLTATVAASGTTSGTINLAGKTAIGLYIPASMTSTSITFTVCDTATGTFVPLADETNTYTLTFSTAARYIALKPNIMAGIEFLKIVCGSTESSERSFKLACRSVT